jgi:tetraacyldisaccharide 4'-kinase
LDRVCYFSQKQVLRSFRYLLIPFSLVYGLVVALRNWLYDKGYLTSTRFNFPVICVGNLAVGGTGKTPMVEYLLRFLDSRFQLATISRGYKRKTRGFGIANTDTTALDIGDEPMLFHTKFPKVTVAVGEERLLAIPQLLQEKPDTEVIILDDAFQHRQVDAGMNILLTEYRNLYTRDFLLPGGDLRDSVAQAKRAQILIVTKCPADLSEEKKNALIRELKPAPQQQVFFTTLVYGQPYQLFSGSTTRLTEQMELLLVTGISNPRPLKQYLTDRVKSFDMITFRDHHVFDSDDLDEILASFSKIRNTDKIMLTTEKDGMRLKKFEQTLSEKPLFVLPMQHRFLFNEELRFQRLIIDYVDSFSRKPASD